MQSWSRTPARSLLFVCHLLMLELWHKRTLSHFKFRRLEASRYRRTATTTQCVECEWCRLIIHLLLKISSEFNSIFSISQRNSQSRMNDMSVLSIVVSWTLSSPEFREWRMRITKSRSSWISRKTLRVNCFSWIRCRCRIGQVHMAFNENIPAKLKIIFSKTMFDGRLPYRRT